MARLSPSSNNSAPSPDPRTQQGNDDDNNNNSNNNNHDRDQDPDDRDRPSMRIGSPDDVDVRRTVAPGQPSPVSTSSEGYPSWLPKRPPPPAPGSTLHSLSTHMMFGSDGAGPSDLPPASEDRPPQTPVPFSGGRKPTPRSVRIVSMQDSNATASGAGAGSGGRRGPTERSATTRVSSTAAAAPPPPPRFPSLPFLPLFFRSREWSRATASALGGLSPTVFSSSQTPDARVRAAIAAPPKFRSPGLHLELLRDPSWMTRLHFYLFPILVFAHVPLQTYLDFNAVFILIE
jgi:hypothetical protein